MKQKIDIPATLALLGVLFAWSVVPLFLKYFTSYIDAWTANSIRYTCSTLIYIPWLIAVWRRGQLKWRLWKLALIPTIINIIGQICWAWSPYFIDAGLLSFVARLYILWSVIGSFILFKDERRLIRSRGFWIGFIFAITGFFCMIFGGHYSFKGPAALGIFLAVLSSVFWAGYQLSVRKNLSTLDSRTAFGIVACMSSIGLLGCWPLFGKPGQVLHIPFNVMILVILSGLIGIAACHVLLYFAMKRIGVAICSTTNLASAFITAFISKILFNESLTTLQWFAGILLLCGGLFLIRAQLDIKKTS